MTRLTNPFFLNIYFYSICTLFILLVCLIKSIKTSKNSTCQLTVTKFDLIILGLGLFTFTNIILTNPGTVKISDFYFLSIYSLIYLSARMLSNINLNGLRYIALFLVVIGIIELLLGVMQIFNLSKSSDFFKVTGGLSSPSIYTNFLASILPFSFYLYSHKSETKLIRLTGALTTALILIIVVTFTQSRTAWMTLILITGLIFLIERGKIPTVNKKSAALISAFTLVAGIFFCYLLSIKSGSTSGRWFVINNTVDLLKRHLISGIGIGNFDKYYNDFQENYFRNHLDATNEYLASYIVVGYNDYLQFWLEGGLPAIVFSLLIAYRAFFILREKKIKRDTAPIIKPFVICLLAIAFMAIFSFPFRLSSIMPQFILAISVLAGMDKKIVFNIKSKLLSYVTLCLSLLLFGRIIITHNSMIRLSAINAYTIDKAVDAKTADELYKNLWPEFSNNIKYLEDYAQRLFVKGDYRGAIRVLKFATLYTSKYDVYLLLGMSYEKDDTKKAEEAYLKCSYLVPGLYTAKYKLMMLYLNNKDLANAKIWADIIYRMPEKVKSVRVKDIKASARAISQK